MACATPDRRAAIRPLPPSGYVVPARDRYAWHVELRIGERRRYRVALEIESLETAEGSPPRANRLQVQYDDVIEVKRGERPDLVELDEQVARIQISPERPPAAAGFDPGRAQVHVVSRFEPSGGLISRTILATADLPRVVLNSLVLGSQLEYLVVPGAPYVVLGQPWTVRKEAPFAVGTVHGLASGKCEFTLTQVGECDHRPCALLKATETVSISGPDLAGEGATKQVFEIDPADGRPRSAEGWQSASYRQGRAGSGFAIAARVHFTYRLEPDSLRPR
ncbi:MAG TPA: hypothetical protein VKN99_11735 [Polyangia bacterium]|nr:hypothetical protein [Polyangia bacterium]